MKVSHAAAASLPAASSLSDRSDRLDLSDRSDLSDLSEFAAEVGSDGPVCAVGGRTQWEVGGLPDAGAREVVAPVGVVFHQPEEMIVRVRAGTTVAALNEVLALGGQMVPLDPIDPARATVGGVLAVGHSGIRRLRYGPARNTVLEVRFVSAAGEMVKAGGPVVKNVTGFDLCRLLVGSLGTLGLIAEVVLRCYPLPEASCWLRSAAPGTVDPFDVHHRLYRPSSVLWDGAHVWALLEGHPSDLDAQVANVLGPAFVSVPGPPDLPRPGRLSLPPGLLPSLPVPALRQAGPPDWGSGPALGGAPGPVVGEQVGGRWLAQVGIGTVLAENPAALAAAVPGLGAWPRALAPRVADLHRELKRRFDPEGRLNPGRQVAVGA